MESLRVPEIEAEPLKEDEPLKEAEPKEDEPLQEDEAKEDETEPLKEDETEAPPPKKPQKPIEKLPCPKCGRTFAKQVLMYRTHKCEPPVLPQDEPPQPPQEPPQEPPELVREATAAPIPEEPKPEMESLSVLIKRDRDAKRQAKRQLYRAHMF